MQYQYTHMRVAKMEKKNQCGQGCGEPGSCTHCWWECKSVQTHWQYLLKPSIYMFHDPVTSFLGIRVYSVEMCTYVPQKMFLVSVIVKILKLNGLHSRVDI